MSRRALVIAAAGVGSTIVAACLVDIPDVVSDGGPDAIADVAADGSLDAPSLPDGVVPTCEAGACGAPPGFTPILFAGDRSAACPAGATTYDLVADPIAAPASACTCDCAVTTQPTCVPQVLVHFIDDGGSCNTQSALKPVVDGGCNQLQTGAIAAAHWAVPPVAPVTPGTCSSTPTTDSTKVTTSPARLCVDPSCGTCTAPAGFQVCWEAPGDVACPTTTTKHLAGASASVTCSACKGCSVSAECGGTVTLFEDNKCKIPIGPVPVDGGCASTGSGSGNFPLGSLQYAPAIVGLTCAGGQSAPTATSVTSPVTICCP